MLAFLVFSSNASPELSFDDIKQKDFVAVMGDPKHEQLIPKIQNEISGEKFILSKDTNSSLNSLHLKVFEKEKIKIGGLMVQSNENELISNYLIRHNDLYVLLLDGAPEVNETIMNYIKRNQPKYVFYNDDLNSMNSVRKIGNTKIIGVSTLTVERYNS